MNLTNQTRSKIRIISRSGEPFRDRTHAGKLMAVELAEFRGKHPVILGIPRGGIVVAREIARALDGDLDIVLARKLGTPDHEELAMGSLSEGGEMFLNRDVVEDQGISQEEIQYEKNRQMIEIGRRSKVFRQALSKTPLEGRVVIVTDDGVATGATMQAALWAARQEKPGKLVAAIPVASEEAVIRLSADVDKLICLKLPAYFAAVGQFYEEFGQISDEEVRMVMEEEARRRQTRTRLARDQQK
jgi:putative phosphoribosyl transferase